MYLKLSPFFYFTFYLISMCLTQSSYSIGMVIHIWMLFDNITIQEKNILAVISHLGWHAIISSNPNLMEILSSMNLSTITLSIYSTFITKRSMTPTAENTTLSSSYSGTSLLYVMMYRVNFTHLWNMDRIIVLLNDDRACSKLSIMLFQCSSMLS